MKRTAIHFEAYWMVDRRYRGAAWSARRRARLDLLIARELTPARIAAGDAAVLAGEAIARARVSSTVGFML